MDRLIDGAGYDGMPDIPPRLLRLLQLVPGGERALDSHADTPQKAAMAVLQTWGNYTPDDNLRLDISELSQRCRDAGIDIKDSVHHKKDRDCIQIGSSRFTWYVSRSRHRDQAPKVRGSHGWQKESNEVCWMMLKSILAVQGIVFDSVDSIGSAQ